MGAFLYFGQLLAFGACLSTGLLVRSSDVRCELRAVTVPLPIVAQQQNVPCDAEERDERPGS